MLNARFSTASGVAAGARAGGVHLDRAGERARSGGDSLATLTVHRVGVGQHRRRCSAGEQCEVRAFPVHWHWLADRIPQSHSAAGGGRRPHASHLPRPPPANRAASPGANQTPSGRNQPRKADARLTTHDARPSLTIPPTQSAAERRRTFNPHYTKQSATASRSD